MFKSPDSAVLDAPDNLVVSPQGAPLICEDSGNSPFMRGVTVDGEIFDFARNIQNGLSGRVRRLTFAIWGPWDAAF